MIRAEVVVDTKEEFEQMKEQLENNEDPLKLFAKFDIYCMYDGSSHYYVFDNFNNRFINIDNYYQKSV